MQQDNFILADGIYLLNHSVGRPLKSSEAAFHQAVFAPWQGSSREPWGEWLGAIDHFTSGLAKLFNSNQRQFCPQVNLSSALTKLVMSLPRLTREGAVILMSEIDFPSMGFALRQALPHCQLRFIARELDVTDPQVWADHLKSDVDLVFISHAYSNTGQQAPIGEVIKLAKANNSLSIIDVAQSAGVLPIDLTALAPDFMIGSSVKWLCGGPGAAYLWLHEDHIDACQPKDVGWFSHENPFEFDIHQFRYHPSALKFWGGTPSVAPYAIAGHSIDFFAKLGVEVVRQHNQQQIDKVAAVLGEQFVSPRAHERRSGTMILQFGERQGAVMQALEQAKISVDQRQSGIRVSPHIYNDDSDIASLIEVLQQFA
ncbi:aminotransferase class V-fold PLP-dependent enzyme [Shewanella sp. AS1]|uniref:aminotransferase class V-fold PLP-dependent enzyme n=1 Tax=Shewanella sp. AS1 TaxID=2907626 RepID=UPI001F28ABCA|nr:aminotransferase class V-fold PLP-dependent enzyme [Shewanella sp. AS1]MCE9680098.1 aminotransferase class V-fold PLP-dependent enzyme [Shewanella sp. AS1]